MRTLMLAILGSIGSAALAGCGGATTPTDAPVDTPTSADGSDAGSMADVGGDTGAMDVAANDATSNDTTTTDGTAMDTAPQDAAADVPITSEAGTPPVVSFMVQPTCPTFSACGGNPVGTWFYTSICLADPSPQLRMACSGARLVSGSGTIQGYVTFTDTTVLRDVQYSWSAVINLPAACTFGRCADAQSALDANYPGSTCTADGTGGCNCNVMDTKRISGAGTYTVSGGTLTVTDGSTTSDYDFCVMGSMLTYRSAGGAATDPGVITLTFQ